MAERRPIIAANWKMHKTHLEAIQAVQRLSYLLDKKDWDGGLQLVNQSLALKEDWFNDWTKAQLLAGKGDSFAEYLLQKKKEGRL